MGARYSRSLLMTSQCLFLMVDGGRGRSLLTLQGTDLIALSMDPWGSRYVIVRQAWHFPVVTLLPFGRQQQHALPFFLLKHTHTAISLYYDDCYCYDYNYYCYDSFC